MSLKSSSAESSSDEQEDADILKTELSKLQAENEMLRNEISELKAEVAKSTVELSSWNKANITLQKICENQKQASDKTGIGFNDNVDATASSRPPISPDLSAVFADFQAALSEQIFVSQSDMSSRLHKLEQSVCDSLRDQADIFRNLSQGARQEVRTLDDVHTIRFNEFHKNVLTQNASIFQRLADVRQVVEAVNAKVDIMAKRLNDIQKDAEASKEALSHQLLEFQSSAQENHNVIHAQLSELVDYIHRGSADKKGESGSRGLQKPTNTQKEGSAVTPTFEQRVQMAQRRIVQTVLDADANRALLESQDAAERDRERRRKEAKSLKRRRRD
ncbi:Phytoalexin-deficient 4-2 protein [Dorcoceras hygrometricum]|uniref:Phytoalexin-deficient 4-2 protein n=1 Tax=Dorcoceras hygrometricum TaxID=472368 RepID=A0A2Z7A3I4_9LAMI|nr:Phytoalexin-deficient 4-2 protein [Dorcoceras hygrometricum]